MAVLLRALCDQMNYLIWIIVGLGVLEGLLVFL